MTFKHTDPKDSNIMKYFEQEAFKRGLISPEASVIKTAAEKPLINKFASLDENILKLCSELRKNNLHAKADELESNFLSFKVANNGEKRIENAHPESPKFGDSEYGIIENILQEHKKILDMINKKPTGKLTNSNNIINSVKHVLGENVEVEFGEINVTDPNSINESYVVTDKDRIKSAIDTAKSALITLDQAKGYILSNEIIDSGDVKEFLQTINNLKSQITYLPNTVSAKDLENLISTSVNFKKYIIEQRNSTWRWLNRPIGSELYTKTYNYLYSLIQKVSDTLLRSYQVLNGQHDNFLKNYHEKQNKKEIKVNTRNIAENISNDPRIVEARQELNILKKTFDEWLVRSEGYGEKGKQAQNHIKSVLFKYLSVLEGMLDKIKHPENIDNIVSDVVKHTKQLKTSNAYKSIDNFLNNRNT